MKYKNEQFEVVSIYNERVSGRLLYKRKEQQRLLYDCGIDVSFYDRDQPLFKISDRPSLYDVIIVANTSRFSRNLVEMKQMITALTKKNVKMYFDDLSKFSDDKEMEMTLSLLFVLDESYSQQVQQKVLHGMKRRREMGYLPNNGLMFGMDYLPKPENRLVPNEDSPTVVSIFNDYKNGGSCRSLGIKYNMQPHTINDIINNAKYAGLNYYGRYDKNGKNTPIDTRNYFETDRIEPIISKELWYECQKIKKSRTTHAGQGFVRGVNNNTYSLSSKIKCASCGKNFYSHSTGKRMIRNWRCRTRSNDNDKCMMPDINERRIIEYLKNGFFNNYIENIKGSIKLVLEQHNRLDREETHNKLIETDNKIKKILELYLDGSIEKDVYEERYNQLINDKANIEEILSNIDNYNNYYEEICRKEKKFVYELETMSYNINILDDYESVFNKISQIIIDKKYDYENNKIVPCIKEIKFKGFEILSDITKELPFGKL